MNSPVEILEEALGTVRYKLNGTQTNYQLVKALKKYAKIYHELKLKKMISDCCDAELIDFTLYGYNQCSECQKTYRTQ